MILGNKSLALRAVVYTVVLVALALAGAVNYWASCPSTNACPCGDAAAAQVDPAPAPEPVGPTALAYDGSELRLSQIAPGKPVAIVVMKGTWCGVCTSQLQRLHKRRAELGG